MYGLKTLKYLPFSPLKKTMAIHGLGTYYNVQVAWEKSQNEVVSVVSTQTQGLFFDLYQKNKNQDQL